MRFMGAAVGKILCFLIEIRLPAAVFVSGWPLSCNGRSVVMRLDARCLPFSIPLQGDGYPNARQ